MIRKMNKDEIAGRYTHFACFFILQLNRTSRPKKQMCVVSLQEKGAKHRTHVKALKVGMFSLKLSPF